MLKLSLLSLAFLAGVVNASAQVLREVDDGYTIGQRFAQYRDKYPGIAWSPVTWRSGQSVLFDRPYKNTGTRDLAIDIFQPSPDAPKRRQGLVLVHGGGWRAGNKSHFYALANLLAQRGYTIFLPEFRLSAEAPYPAGMIDIGDALAWARDHAADFGLDAKAIAIGGASSGGQMAALLAYAGPSGLFGAGASRRANALIDLDGVLDFTLPETLKFEDAAKAASPAARWLGGSYETATARWREASPVMHLGPDAVPTLIIGSGIARFTQGKDAVRAGLAQYRIGYREFHFANAPHDFWLFDPWLARVVREIDGFFTDVVAKGEAGK